MGATGTGAKATAQNRNNDNDAKDQPTTCYCDLRFRAQFGLNKVFICSNSYYSANHKNLFPSVETKNVKINLPIDQSLPL